MLWTHIDTLQNYSPHPNKNSVGNKVSGDKTEILQKATYVQIITGYQIGRIDDLDDQNSDQNNRSLLKDY